MPTSQGDVGLLHDPVAQQLLQAKGPAQLEGAAHLYPRMTRIFIHPDWVGILNFETRLPSAVERALERG